MEKITINDIAKLAGVSKTTVSFYLNGMYEKMSDDTREKIEKVIEKTGYRPSVIARSLNAKSSKMIGVIIGDVANNFANHVIKGIEQACKEKGYKVFLASSDYSLENEKQYLQFMASVNVDGFIVQPTVGFEDTYKTIAGEKPLVIFDSPVKDSKYNWVKTDSYASVYALVTDMIKEGYKRFVYITADPYVLNTRKERYDGFMAAVDNHQLFSKVLVINDENVSKESLEPILPLINDDEPIGIIVANNWLLREIYLAFEKYMDKVPKQVGLAGFDSLEWSNLAKPSITTIVQPSFEEGMAAANMLIDLIEGNTLEEKFILLPCYINKKESTKRVVEGKE